MPVEQAWLGLAWHPDGRRLYTTGGDQVQEFAYDGGHAEAAPRLPAAHVADRARRRLAVTPDGRHLFVTRALEQKLIELSVESGAIEQTVDLPAEVYGCLLSRDGKTAVRLAVGRRRRSWSSTPRRSSWCGEARVGEHPNAMALAPSGDRLFVACANTNAVWVVDTASMKATEQIARRACSRRRPAGTTPNGLGALARTAATLLVANADNNDGGRGGRGRRRAQHGRRASSRPAGIRPPSASTATAARSTC